MAADSPASDPANVSILTIKSHDHTRATGRARRHPRRGRANSAPGFPANTGASSIASGDYPTEFVHALTEAGYLSVLIPEEYGGAGLGISAARRRSWKRSIAPAATAAPATRRCTSWAPCCGTAATRRSETICRRSPPANCACRPSASPNRPAAPTRRRLQTFAKRQGDHYVVNGQKIWTSRAEHSDLMLLLARTTPKDQAQKRTDGLSVLHRRHARGEEGTG